MVAHAAASIPSLDVWRVLDERNSASVAQTAARYDALATAARVTGTPTFVIRQSFGGTATTLIAPNEATLSTALDPALTG